MNKHACNLDISAINFLLQLTHNLSFLTSDIGFLLRWVSVEMNWQAIFFKIKLVLLPFGYSLQI